MPALILVALRLCANGTGHRAGTASLDFHADISSNLPKMEALAADDRCATQKEISSLHAGLSRVHSMIMRLTRSLRGVNRGLHSARWQVYAGLQRVAGAVRKSLRPDAMPGRQIVVCGFPRGGTSLLYNMLSSSLDGFGFAEFEVAAWKVIARWGDFASKKPLDVLDFGQPGPPQHPRQATGCHRHAARPAGLDHVGPP